jgi:predicted N-acetyltransferase YhbS
VATNTLALDLNLPFRKGAVEYTPGHEADHEAVYQTLLNVFHRPDRDDFLATLSDPAYRPEQRLLVKVGGKIASHVYLTDRQIRLAGEVARLHGVMWVGTLPEYRGRGFAQNLIRLASQRARKQGALLMTASTSMPEFFKPLGWGVCGRHGIGLIPSRNLPTGNEGALEVRGPAWQVRPWRQVELGDLMRLYELQFAETPGSLVRSEEYWRWMVNRRIQHVIWIACLGDAVHGYAFVKDHKVLEIAVDPAHPDALPALFGRIRSEALERAYPEVILHAPPDHVAMQQLKASGGKILHREEWEGDVQMYHAPDPGLLLARLLPQIARHAKQAGAALPLDLGLSIGDQRFLIHIAAGKSSRIESGKLGRRHLTLSGGSFVRLLLGHSSIDHLISEDRVVASSATAIEAARLLFPPRILWRSPLDCVAA